MRKAPQRGQRWTSESEPDLGLGAVVRATARTITVAFGATGETREYSLDHAPLRRVRFQPGDTLRSRDEKPLQVQAVSERNGLLFYQGENRELCETELSDRLSFSGPLPRLLAGDWDPAATFDLRMAALGHQHRRRKSKVRGFTGGRIDLIPHQLYIAAEVTGRMAPRVLLADEVGLGKTIEACLILHRLLLTGRARRVLILLPDSLLHQWFLELYRRFQLWFHIFDEERCQALEASTPGANPFDDDQLVICGLGLLARDPRRAAQALEAEWDLLVVDEAHHLAWSPEEASPGYLLVERLAAAVPGLLLLTATPEQLGMPSHFARLRLLDPDRFFDLDAFAREARQFRTVATLAEKLRGEESLAPDEVQALAAVLGEAPAKLQAGLDVPGARETCVDALLDRHGTGRVMFRNTRATIKGFPKRTVRMAPLDDNGASRTLAAEFAADAGGDGATTFRPEFSKDPRLDWLADLLRRPETGKVLLICRTKRKAEAIVEALKSRIKVKMAAFHEGLTLVQRDRNAAWFAEPDGARLLVCSEIGSEGRNFQFACHLALFDLPLDPDLLEQRIGRLDRVGQTRDIQVHVPYVSGGPQEVLARWFHEGLDAFQENLGGGRELLEAFKTRILAQAAAGPASGMEALIRDTRKARADLRVRLEAGRDRLLEMNSFRPQASAALAQEIRDQDANPALDRFMMAIFEHFFVEVDELGHRTCQLGSMGVLAETFPGLPPEGLTVTFDRQRALDREDIQFLTWDHPLVNGALDLLLGSPKGTCAFSRWPGAKLSGLCLEAVFELACVAPPSLHVDRFLPPTPVRVLIDHRGRDLTRTFPRSQVARAVQPVEGQGLLERPEVRQELTRMLRLAEDIVSAQAPLIQARAEKEMARQLDAELQRLQALRKVNAGVGAGEIRLALEQRAVLEQHLRDARLRLDALHVIHCTL